MACPICGKETQKTYRPFCSKRCADVDLSRWLGECYAIPSSDPQDADEAARAAEEATPKPH